LSIVIRGRVQGVGFRYFTLDSAGIYGISGWVRNGDDGSVEIEAQAEELSLHEFVENVKEGPPGSEVLSCSCSEINVIENEKNFKIRH